MSDERIVVGLDIGTTKVGCVIGEIAEDGVLDVIGFGQVASDGMKKGIVVHLERTVDAVQRAVAAAERVAGVTVSSAWVGVGGSHLTSLTSHGMAAIRRGQDIARSDLERTIENARAVPLGAHLDVLHVVPQEYVVDGNDGIVDPVGMSGVRLEVDVHIVAASQGPLANLRRCVEDAGIRIEGFVAQSLASGLAVRTDAERELTTLVIDVGGGTTDVGVFRRGVLSHSAVVPIGGDYVTQDISQILRIPPEEAERVKVAHGVAIPDLADRDVVLEVTNPSYVATISTYELAQVVKPRIKEILDTVKHEVEKSLGSLELNAGNVVLTGGASTMPGVEQLATERLRLPVRIGRPHGVSGLTDQVAIPSASTAVGLVRYAAKRRAVAPSASKPSSRDPREGPTIVGRLRNLFRDFF